VITPAINNLGPPITIGVVSYGLLLEQGRITQVTKRLFVSAFLSVPLRLIATAASRSATHSDAFRYVFSPGTMVALRFAVEPSCRGLGGFIDAISWISRSVSFAFVVNSLLYCLLMFAAVVVRHAFGSRASRMAMNADVRALYNLGLCYLVGEEFA